MRRQNRRLRNENPGETGTRDLFKISHARRLLPHLIDHHRAPVLAAAAPDVPARSPKQRSGWVNAVRKGPAFFPAAKPNSTGATIWLRYPARQAAANPAR